MKNILIFIFVLAAFVSCKESVWNVAPKDGVTPGPVRSYIVENMSGKSIIYFDVPDENTLYVEAEYKLANGEIKNTKASRYSASLTVEGFSRAQDYEVKLYAVGKNEQRSAPLSIVVSPTMPPYMAAFESLQISETFGGVTVQTSNPEKEALVIETLLKKTDGSWESLDRYYTSTDQVKFHVRGLPSEEQTFGFFVRDRWLNYSDTVETTLLPLAEIQIPPVDISEITATSLPGSAPIFNNSSQYNAKKAVNGVIGKTVNEDYYLTAPTAGVPQHFNVDLKKAYQLSRVVFYQRPNYFYRTLSPRKVAIWGSNAPAPDGSFNGWTLLGQFEVIKPSGQPMDVNSDEDIAAAVAGHNFEFDGATIPVRYLRFQTLETWDLTTNVTLTEYSIFGNIAN